ncbi:hypothetical protein CBR_g28040 [Chara braunii]|uniref:TOG domain-containing protein n=1 Tax=Chara braunii TaxID=69332 RepID=A0A388L950_CHABU|nr:hypothetical protein CBR_g28040 [Chara braunii]|eukprot:GBG78816.1 hypothetical protein CBR_g28040 [Chara braunii]
MDAPGFDSASLRVTSSSTKTRVHVFESSVMAALDDPGLDMAESAADIVTVIFKTVHIYEDRTSQAAVERAIERGLARGQAFTKSFAGTLLQIGEKALKGMGVGLCLKLLRWSCLLMRRCPELFGAKTGFARIAALQAAFLTRLFEGGGPRVKRVARKAFARLLSEVAPAYDHYANVLDAVDSSGYDFCGLVWALLEFAAGKPNRTALMEKHKGVFLELCTKRVLSSRQKPPKSAMGCFRPLLRGLSHEEFATALLPTAVKMLKRNPEVVMEAVGQMVADVSLDMSKYMGDFLPTLFQQARHNDEGTRRSALAVVKNLVLQSSDLDSVSTTVDAARSIFSGSEGKLTVWHQRAGMIGVISTVSEVKGSVKAVAALSAGVCSFLVKAYTEEVNEDVKLAALAALGEWLPRAGPDVPKEVTSFFAQGLKEKESLRRAHLRCLRAAFRNGDLRTKVSQSLVDALIGLVKAGAQKPLQRVDGVYALLLVSLIGAVDTAAEDKLVKEKVWPVVLQKDSPLLSSAVVGKLSAEDCVALAELAEVILLQFSPRLDQNPDGARDLFQLLVFLMTYPLSWDVRRTAIAAANRCHTASAGLSESLLDAYCAWLAVWEERMAAQSCAGGFDSGAEAGGGGGGGGGDSAAIIPAGEILTKALAAIASPATASKPGVAARLLLCAHHQVVVRGKRKGVAWAVVERSLTKRGVSVRSVLVSSASVVCKILLGPAGLTSGGRGGKPQEQAALAALGTAMKFFPAQIYPHLLQALDAMGDRSAHDSLTEREVKIFRTPEGVLSTEDGVYVAEVVRDRNVRHARGRFKLYDDATENDPPPPPPPKEVPRERPSQKSLSSSTKRTAGGGGAKKAVDSGKTAKEEAREAQLAEEAAVRQRIAAIKDRLALVLQALAVSAVSCPRFSHDQLPALADRILPLLKSPIVSDEAFDALKLTATCVAPRLRDHSLDVAAALRLVVVSPDSVLRDLKGSADQQQPARKTKLQEKPVVERVTIGLSAACQDGPVPVATFVFSFPVIEHVLLAPAKTKLHDDLLQVLSLHASPGDNLPRQRMIRVLYHALGCVPLYQERIRHILRELAKGLGDEQVSDALDGLYSSHSHVRAACLDSLEFIPALESGRAPPNSAVASALWMAMHDPDEQNTQAGEDIWDMYGHSLGTDYAQGLTKALSHPNLNVRQAAAGGLAAAMETYPATVAETLSALFSLYIRDVPVGRGDHDPSWEGREGVALALKACAKELTTRDLPAVATFLISRALADLNSDVRYRMVDAGVTIIDVHGKTNVGLLLPIFENYLDKKAADEERYDLVREGVVVFMGALAKHMSPEDPKIGAIVERMLEVLNTPSESVQRAVSNCLPPLMHSPQAKPEELIGRLIKRLLEADRYGERRGAAFGLAGAVKGLGISSLKAYGIMDKLKTGVEDKASAKSREGALFAFECLCEKMGRLFEPYVIHILPLLLASFSDPNVAVREATDAAARGIMAQLSGQGVKLVLPALMRGLEDKAWRTKQGSVQFLGAMAYCAPKQLSQCLPTIVPKLSEVLTDTHPKVQLAAQTALQQVGSVIRNPEIASLVPTLLVSIADPNKHTKTSLDLLLQTTFVNSVDPPSLALLVPVVHRGLRERSADTKKKAAQIVGSMCLLVTEHKDMIPYLDLLLPEVKKVLVDPIPEVRTVAARALGSLIQGMGEERFVDLVPWLLETLKSDTSSVERSGAAQGLSEVLAALGLEYFEARLPDILVNCSHQRASVRDGYLTLFKYLPSAIGPEFQAYLSQVLPAILDGLADENESVRDAALSAGHVLVEHYARSSLPLLLPVVEEGIFNDNWRIRQSSVELLGDLLFKVAGASGKVQLEGGSDDEGASTEAQGRAIIEVLGRNKRNEVLAAVYMVRSDVSLSVRQAALHVWKTVVSNTPRTLKEIMPVLMRTLITSLASTSPERRQVAGRALGELVRKLGDRVLPSIIPILRDGLQDQCGNTRQGVCFGLSEVMASAGRQHLAAYMSDLIPTIRDALCDSEPEVQEAAGQAFSTLYKSAGMHAIDEIVPALLHALEDEHLSGHALGGLKQILSVRTAAVLPHILPKLVKPPITEFNANALAALAEVAGAGLNAHLPTVLPPLIMGMSASGNPDSTRAVKYAAETVVMGVDDEGLDGLITELNKGLGDSQASVRTGAAELTGFFFKSTRLDVEYHVPNLITTLIVMLGDPDKGTVKAAWEALGFVIGTIPIEVLPSYIKCVRDAIQTARDKERRKRKGGAILVPGLCLPNALKPVLPIFHQGVMTGSAEIREQAADGLGELADVTHEDSLKPFIVKITGPLIRIIGDRFPWQVKSAILGTLSIIIGKAGDGLKPFVPPLQTSFVKCLQDGARPVRSRAARALGKLVVLSPRVDPLVSELLSGVHSSEGGVKEAMLAALSRVLLNAGKSVSAPVVAKVGPAVINLLDVEDDEVRGLASRCLGIASPFMADSGYDWLLQSITSVNPSELWTMRHGATMTLASVLRHSAHRVFESSARVSWVTASIRHRTKDDRVPVRVSVAKAIGRLVVFQVMESLSPFSISEMVSLLANLIAEKTSDVRRRAMASVKSIAKARADVLTPYHSVLGPPVGDCLKDGNSPVRVAAERCALHLFQLPRGTEFVQAAQKYMTGLDARRIAKLPEVSDVSDDSEGDDAND